jgi:hypothetical protein
MGRHGEAVDAATESLGWAEDAGQLGRQARAHVALAVALGESGRLQAAVEHLYLALACARRLGNPRWEATALQFLGIGHSEAGDFDASEAALVRGPRPEPDQTAEQGELADAATSQPALDPADPSGARSTGTQPSVPARRGGPLLAVAALLAIAGVVLSVIGYYVVGTDSLGRDWFSELPALAETVAAGLVLIIRQPRWGGLLVGLLAWDLPAPALLASLDRSPTGPGSWLLAGNVAAVAASVAGTVALLQVTHRKRPGMAPLLDELAETRHAPTPNRSARVPRCWTAPPWPPSDRARRHRPTPGILTRQG